MIGSGIPISQSSAPFPNDIIVSILTSNALGFHWFRCRLPVPREIASRREPR